jgi:hypothetical protein
MNQLSNIVIDFARFRQVDVAARRLATPDVGGPRRGLLTCHWRRDPATGWLICAWTAPRGAREAEPPSRRSIAA